MTNTLIKIRYSTLNTCNITQISMPDMHSLYPKHELEYHNFAVVLPKLNKNKLPGELNNGFTVVPYFKEDGFVPFKNGILVWKYSLERLDFIK